MLHGAGDFTLSIVQLDPCAELWSEVRGGVEGIFPRNVSLRSTVLH